MSAEQLTSFQAALSTWMRSHALNTGRAAPWLQIKPNDLQAWLDGTRSPSPDELTRILTRIAGGNL